MHSGYCPVQLQALFMVIIASDGKGTDGQYCLVLLKAVFMIITASDGKGTDSLLIYYDISVCTGIIFYLRDVGPKLSVLLRGQHKQRALQYHVDKSLHLEPKTPRLDLLMHLTPGYLYHLNDLVLVIQAAQELCTTRGILIIILPMTINKLQLVHKYCQTLAITVLKAYCTQSCVNLPCKKHLWLSLAMCVCVHVHACMCVCAQNSLYV